MTIFSDKNFSLEHIKKLNDLNISNGDSFKNCNFSQSSPYTPILKDFSDISFIDCNLINCELNSSAKKTGCLHIQKDLCSHIHGVKNAGKTCEEKCKHFLRSMDIYDDGVLVNTINKYEDTVI